MDVCSHRAIETYKFHECVAGRFDAGYRMRRKATTMILKELPSASRSDELSQQRQRVQESLTAMPLDALRDAKQLTQVQMAQLLKISQGAVSKVERRTDMFVSTLRNYVRAIGGDLEIRAVFPDGDVLIDQFGDAKRTENGNRPASKRDERKAAVAV
jgi:transcriptional regulator with XRE-family HTH domain